MQTVQVAALTIRKLEPPTCKLSLPCACRLAFWPSERTSATTPSQACKSCSCATLTPRPSDALSALSARVTILLGLCLCCLVRQLQLALRPTKCPPPPTRPRAGLRSANDSCMMCCLCNLCSLRRLRPCQQPCWPQCSYLVD